MASVGEHVEEGKHFGLWLSQVESQPFGEQVGSTELNVTHIKTKSRIVVTGGRRPQDGGNGDMMIKGYKVSIRQQESVF